MAVVPPALAAQPTPRTPVPCAGQTITEVTIRSQAPAYGAVFARSEFLGEALARLHTTTAPNVIRNFVLLQAGQRCSPLLRAESERILRAMPFIAEATITAYADGPNGVSIEVFTVDEPAIVADAGVRGNAPFVTRLTLGSGNLLGNAVYTSAQWRDGGFYRDALAGRYTNYQLWGRPYQLHLRAARREIGNDWVGEVSYPFLTDVQRAAWRVSGGGSKEFVRFLRPSGPAVALPLERQFMDAGAVARIGPPGQLGLAGLHFSLEDTRPAQEPVVISDSGIVSDSSPELIARYPSWRSVRLNALLGFRRVRFTRVLGFDALSAPQDLRTGIQIGGTVGASLPTSRGIARGEMFAGANLYAGVGGARTFAALEASIEGRQPGDQDWHDVLSNGRLAWYLKPHPRHLITADLSWSSTREARVPVQLSLGERRGGLRGYDASTMAGGARVVSRFEERWRFASFGGSAAAAAAIFTDIGAVTAGDVPFGRNSGLRQSIGTSLMLAVPARSQRMWRVDFAFPVQRADGARFEIRMSSEDRTRSFWRIPNDLQRARERVLPPSIVRWP